MSRLLVSAAWRLRFGRIAIPSRTASLEQRRFPLERIKNAMSSSQQILGNDLSRSSAEIEALGPPTDVFRPSAANLGAGLVLGVLLVFGGCLSLFLIIRAVVENGGHLPVNAERGMSWVAVGLGSLLSLMLVTGGAGLLYWMRSLLSLRVYVCPHGFYCQSATTVRVFPWSEVASVKETIIRERYPVLKGPLKYLLPVKKTHYYCVNRADGDHFVFDCNSIHDHDRAGQLLRQQSQRLDFPWVIVEDPE
jgi:hypothetical protein